jgi:hypothetical protein
MPGALVGPGNAVLFVHWEAGQEEMKYVIAASLPAATVKRTGDEVDPGDAGE